MAFAPVGSYQPLLELASGGMGVVYVARKTGGAGFERLVALKRVHRHVLADPAYRDMLREEARLLSLVHHANVASVLDVVDADGELSIVLEYIESMSLAALLAASAERGERLPVAVTARIVADALAGLQAAHVALGADGKPLGIIHRDVSPQNVLVGVDGVSRLIDFGIAKASRATTPPLEQTDSGVLKGKLRYMSPEQLVQGALDCRSDVYSAGVVLYEAVTGQRLFRPNVDESDALLNQLIGNVAPPTELVPELPAGVEEVVMKALARDRAERFQTAAEFEEALTRAVPVASRSDVARVVESYAGPTVAERRARLRQASQTMPPPAPAPAPASASASASSVSSERTPEPTLRDRRALPIVLAAVAGLGVVAAIGAAALGRRTAERATADGNRARAEEAAAAAPASNAAPVASGDEAATTSDAGATPEAAQGAAPRPRTAPRTRPELHKNPYGHRVP